VEEIATFLQGIAGNSNWAKEAETLQKSLQDLTSISEELLQKTATDENLVNSVAVEYLHLVGYISYGYMWLRMAVAAEQKQAEKPYLASKIKTARFYFARIMPRTHALLGAIKDGSESLYLHDDEQF